MERLFRGIHRFHGSHFKKEEEFFRRLATRQTPEVLFITCADSRVDPNLVTQSKPGDLFILRNVGNIIPPYNAIKDKNSVAAALEFAVHILKVSDIIICGHSNCGAMKFLYEDENTLQSLTHLKEWITLAAPVKHHVEQFYPDISKVQRERITEKENILEQLRNIETYPFVASALQEGSVFLHGWYYDIGKGEVLCYNPLSDKFEHMPSLTKDNG